MRFAVFNAPGVGALALMLLLAGCASVAPEDGMDAGDDVEGDRGPRDVPNIDGGDDVGTEDPQLDASDDAASQPDDGTDVSAGDAPSDSSIDVNDDTGSDAPTDDTRDALEMDPSPEADADDDVLTDISLDEGADPDVDAIADIPGGGPCDRNADCLRPDEVCVLLEGEEPLRSECRPAVGARAPGAVCSFNTQCATSRCWLDGYCQAPCVDNTDCPVDGQACSPFEFTLDDNGTPDDVGDDTTQTVDVCLPDLGTLAPCALEADCSAGGETCGLVFDDRLGVERRCVNPVGSSMDGDCGANATCRTGSCLGAGYCYWACADDGSCAADRDCTPINFGGGGASTVVPGCVPTCESSAECGGGLYCGAFVDDDPPFTLVQLCNPAVGGLDSGATCGSDGECKSGDCFAYGGTTGNRCAGPCDFDGQLGCAGATRCYDNLIYVGFDHGTPANLSDDSSFAFSSCLPDFGSYDECTRDSDCSGGETCVVRTNQTNTAVQPRCIDPVGAGGHGAGCSQDSDCRSSFCGLGGICVGICSVVGDCSGGTSCLTTTFILDERDPDDDDDDITAPALTCR